MFGLKNKQAGEKPRILEIREGGAEDIRGIADVDSLSLDAWGEDALARAMRDAHNRFSIVRLHGELVGFSIYTFLDDLKHFELGRVEVLKDFRRKGLGTLLVREMQRDCFFGVPKDIARRTWIRATLSESNIAGLCFLRGCGFGRATLLKDHFGDEDGVRQFWQPPLDDLLA